MVTVPLPVQPTFLLAYLRPYRGKGWVAKVEGKPIGVLAVHVLESGCRLSITATVRGVTYRSFPVIGAYCIFWHPQAQVCFSPRSYCVRGRLQSIFKKITSL